MLFSKEILVIEGNECYLILCNRFNSNDNDNDNLSLSLSIFLNILNKRKKID